MQNTHSIWFDKIIWAIKKKSGKSNVEINEEIYYFEIAECLLPLKPASNVLWKILWKRTFRIPAWKLGPGLKSTEQPKRLTSADTIMPGKPNIMIDLGVRTS